MLVNSRGCVDQSGPAQSQLRLTAEGNKVPVVHIKNILGKIVWVIPVSAKGKTIIEAGFAQEPGWIWWVMWEDWEVQCMPQEDLVLDGWK